MIQAVAQTAGGAGGTGRHNMTLYSEGPLGTPLDNPCSRTSLVGIIIAWLQLVWGTGFKISCYPMNELLPGLEALRKLLYSCKLQLDTQ